MRGRRYPTLRRSMRLNRVPSCLALLSHQTIIPIQKKISSGIFLPCRCCKERIIMTPTINYHTAAVSAKPVRVVLLCCVLGRASQQAAVMAHISHAVQRHAQNERKSPSRFPTTTPAMWDKKKKHNVVGLAPFSPSHHEYPASVIQ